MIAYIYIIENTTNSKKYVGQSWNVTKRLLEHSRGKYSGCTLLVKAVKKYGWNAFRTQIHEFNNISQEQLDFLECEHIKSYNSIHPEGYNLKTGGRGGRHNNYTKDKLSEVNRGKKLSIETRQKISEGQKGRVGGFAGKKHSEESKQRTSDTLKGKVPWNKGLPGTFTGKKHTEESKQKVSLANKGKQKPPRSEEHKRRLSEARRGKGSSMKGKPWSIARRTAFENQSKDIII